MQIISDHIKASVFLIVGGIKPSNKEQGYVLRKLLRRAAIKIHQLRPGLKYSFEQIVDNGILKIYDKHQNINRTLQKNNVLSVISEEINKFSKTLFVAE